MTTRGALDARVLAEAERRAVDWTHRASVERWFDGVDRRAVRSSLDRLVSAQLLERRGDCLRRKGGFRNDVPHSYWEALRRLPRPLKCVQTRFYRQLAAEGYVEQRGGWWCRTARGDWAVTRRALAVHGLS